METIADIKCLCGADPGPEWREIARMLPSVPALCPSCEAKAEADDKRAQDSARSEEETRQRSERLAVIPPEIAATDIHDPRFNAKLWNAVSDWSPTRPKWLGIVGPPGSCKTRCLGLLARKMIMEGRHLAWATACEFQACVEDLRSKRPAVSEPARDRLREMKSAGILVFDDIGKNTWSATIERHLFDLIDYRKTRYMPVLWTANRRLEDLLSANVLTEERAGPIIGRIIEASRQVILK